MFLSAQNVDEAAFRERNEKNAKFVPLRSLLLVSFRFLASRAKQFWDSGHHFITYEGPIRDAKAPPLDPATTAVLTRDGIFHTSLDGPFSRANLGKKRVSDPDSGAAADSDLEETLAHVRKRLQKGGLRTLMHAHMTERT